jgi:hypothetical protein
MMRGASLRSVADLLGHTTVKMTMRYAHLSPAFLQAEISLLDESLLEPSIEKRARKGQLYSSLNESRSELPDFVPESGSPHWTISATGWSEKLPRRPVIDRFARVSRVSLHERCCFCRLRFHNGARVARDWSIDEAGAGEMIIAPGTLAGTVPRSLLATRPIKQPVNPFRSAPVSKHLYFGRNVDDIRTPSLLGANGYAEFPSTSEQGISSVES